MLSWVEGAFGAGVLVRQGSSCRAVVPFKAGPGHRDIGWPQITVVTLKERKRKACFKITPSLQQMTENVTFEPPF